MSILIFRRRHHTVPPYLQFTTQPVGAASGSNWATQPVVTAKNADGTTKTSFVGVVTVALNALTGSPTLTGTATATAVAGVATFSGLGTTGGASTWTVTATAPGYSSATSTVGTTTGGGGTQFSEDWSSNSIRSTLWTTTLSGTGAASAASGALALSLSAGGSAQVAQPGSSANRYDLTTAGALANGVTADISNLGTAGARFYFAIIGSDGAGWAFHMEVGSLYWQPVTAGSGNIEARVGATIGSAAIYNATSHRYMRFRKVGGTMEVTTSSDLITWNNVWGTNTVAIGTETVTTMGIAFEVDAGGAAMTANIDNIVFN